MNNANQAVHTLYKFRAVNKYLIESLVTPSLYFAKPSTLNDPFDCRPNFKVLLKNALLTSTGVRKEFLSKQMSKFLEYDWEDMFKDHGIFSASSGKIICEYKELQRLLWSHYADEHRGLRIKYEIPESFLKGKKRGVSDVMYDVQPFTTYLSGCNTNDEDFYTFLYKSYLIAKHPAWMHEDEKRIIRESSGIFLIPGEFIKEICFGLRTPKEDIQLIRKLAMNHCGLTNFYQMIRNDKDFGFEMSKLPQ